MSVEENMRLMKTLDDAWNSQNWDTFDKRHTEDVAMYWPGKANLSQQEVDVHIKMKL
jgi:hypothetical protein